MTEQAKTLGTGDRVTRAKANNAKERNMQESESWPTVDGRPLVKIQMQASELIPTGQYANVSIGPAVVTAYIDPEQPGGLPGDWKENVAEAVNDLAELVERDVVAVQRNLVLQSMQDQISQ
jgi:hypothetical protein